MEMSAIMQFIFWGSLLIYLIIFLTEKKSSIHSFLFGNNNWNLNVPYTKLIKEIIAFSGENLLMEKNKILPFF